MSRHFDVVPAGGFGRPGPAIDFLHSERGIVMLTHDEKERLLREMRYEPARVVGAVLKSVVCLLAVAGLAWIGISTSPDQDAALAFHPPAAGVPAPHPEHASVVDARKVFEERRARFDGQSTGPQNPPARQRRDGSIQY